MIGKEVIPEEPALAGTQGTAEATHFSFFFFNFSPSGISNPAFCFFPLWKRNKEVELSFFNLRIKAPELCLH